MRKIKSKIKRGQMSKAEKDMIEIMCVNHSDQEIADKLRRPVERIQMYKAQFLGQNPNITVTRSEQAEIKEKLRLEPEWNYFKEQFTPDELILFEHSYAELIQQFKNDILPTEKKQLYYAITLEILIHRHNHDRMLAQQDIGRLERLLAAEYKQDESMQDKQYLLSLESELQAARASTNSRTKELKDLMDKHQDIVKSLKGTREQRIQKIESSKQTFIGLLRQLEEEDTRRAIGVEMNLMSAAIEKERARLAEYHEYQDGTVDTPVLDSESVIKDEVK